MLTLDSMDLLHAQTRRRKRDLMFFIWETVRFGLLWNVTSAALNIDRSYATAVYLLYIMSPGLAVVAGFFLIWKLGDKVNRVLYAVMVMAKGFQAVLGTAAAVLLLRSSLTHPIFYRAEFMVTGIIALADLAVCSVLMFSRRKAR